VEQAIQVTESGKITRQDRGSVKEIKRSV